jgi:hypothetical protein
MGGRVTNQLVLVRYQYKAGIGQLVYYKSGVISGSANLNRRVPESTRQAPPTSHFSSCNREIADRVVLLRVLLRSVYFGRHVACIHGDPTACTAASGLASSSVLSSVLYIPHPTSNVHIILGCHVRVFSSVVLVLRSENLVTHLALLSAHVVIIFYTWRMEAEAEGLVPPALFIVQIQWMGKSITSCQLVFGDGIGPTSPMGDFVAWLGPIQWTIGHHRPFVNQLSFSP